MNNAAVSRAACAAVLLCIAPAAPGQPQPNDPAAPTPPAVPIAPEAAPLPDYSGDWAARQYLTGDWRGRRSNLAEAGLTLDMSWTQITQGVIKGGLRWDWDYGGNLNMLLNADLERLGLVPGGTLYLRGESRYAETVNDDSGAFTPVNTRGYFPLTDRVNQGIPFSITELAYTQSLSETLEVTVGKMLAAEGDPTEFAGGLGRTQFFNSNFIYNAATSQTAPYSTLGAAVDWYPAQWITLSTSLFATVDSSTTTGFDDLNDGWTWWTQAATQYSLAGLPGGANAGFQYAFDNQFTKIDGRLTLVPGGVGSEIVSHTWAVFCGAWQYFYTPDVPPATIDASDDHADMRGLGFFARLGFADPDANPVKWSASIGLGGRGLVPGRDDDTFGVGYYHTDLQNSREFSLLGLPSSSQGCEAFYNISITPAIGLTLDLQWVDEGLSGTDAATILGLRLDVEF